MNNAKAFYMLESRFSEQIKTFNRYCVSDDDSDAHYWAVKDRIELAKTALDRAPEMQITTLARSLGDVYIAIRQNLTPEEKIKWNSLVEILEILTAKYM